MTADEYSRDLAARKRVANDAAQVSTVRIDRTWTDSSGIVVAHIAWTSALERVGHECIVVAGGYVHIGEHRQPNGLTMRTTFASVTS